MSVRTLRQIAAATLRRLDERQPSTRLHPLDPAPTIEPGDWYQDTLGDVHVAAHRIEPWQAAAQTAVEVRRVPPVRAQG